MTVTRKVSLQDVMPMLPGYSLGSIVDIESLTFALWSKECAALEEELHRAKTDLSIIQDNADVSNDSSSETQKKVTILDSKIFRLQKEYEVAYNKIGELCITTSAQQTSFSIQETLPIDTAYSKVKVENRAFESEKLDHQIIFHRTTQHVQDVVKKFVFRLFPQDVSSTCLPLGALEGFASSIENMLEREAEIYLVGSFITLSRVRVMDPIVIRKNAISENLKTKAAKYCVLTEAVLGGVFLGYGKRLAGAEGSMRSGEVASTRSVVSRAATISFISQGAIPKVNANGEDVNLWSVYMNWKDTLQKDEKCGYPIGVRFRKLEDILRENNISL